MKVEKTRRSFLRYLAGMTGGLLVAVKAPWARAGHIRPLSDAGDGPTPWLMACADEMECSSGKGLKKCKEFMGTCSGTGGLLCSNFGGPCQNEVKCGSGGHTNQTCSQMQNYNPNQDNPCPNLSNG